MPRSLILAAIGLGGCFPDDWNGQPYVPAGSTPTPPDDTGAPVAGGEDIVGTWTSEGSDLSDLFASEPFAYDRVECVFLADGTYVVTSVDGEGTEYVLRGTYTTPEPAEDGPTAVTLQQVDPYVATALGIWEVEGDTLTYEVVQTVPDYGFTPPTVAGGFGSTGGPGMTSGLNVQVYRR
jgi:hypothetical protein